MSNIFEIIDNLGLSKEDSDKLQVYLITRSEERTVLYSALTSPSKTDKDRLRLLKEFLMTITAGMLDKISAITVCDAMTKLFFLFFMWILDEHPGKPLRRNDWL